MITQVNMFDVSEWIKWNQYQTLATLWSSLISEHFMNAGQLMEKWNGPWPYWEYVPDFLKVFALFA